MLVRQLLALEAHAGGELLPLRGQQAPAHGFFPAAVQGLHLGRNQAEIIGQVELVDVFVEELQVRLDLGVGLAERDALLLQTLVEVEDQVAEAAVGGEAAAAGILRSSNCSRPDRLQYSG